MFSITRGGPWYRLMRRMHLLTSRGDQRWRALVLFAWLPVTVVALIPLVLDDRVDPVLVDVSVHARFLVALPLIVLAERTLERRCRSSVRQLRAGRFASRANLDEILDRAERLRDGWVVELVLLVAAVVSGQAALWGWTTPAGLIAGVELGGAPSIARVWYASIALPMIQFLWLRWVWRWLIWIYVLARLSRQRLAMIAIHPDHTAGLAFLDEPTDAFALFVASLASVASAAWIEQLHAGHVTLSMLAPTFGTFLVLALVLAFGPLLLFSGHLYRTRRRDLPLHHELALTYARAFKHKWLQRPRTDEPVLGTPDLQSLNDLAGGFDTTDQTRLIPITPRPVVLVVSGAFVPMLPVLLTAMPLTDVVTHLGKSLLGGLPI